MEIKEAQLVVRPQDLRPMASKIVSTEIERGSNLKIFKILRAAGKKVSTQKAGEGEADKGTNRRGFKVVIEATIKDIKDILTTIGKSQNMDQAVQMVMKKYKVDQGKAKAMVKKAIDSGVTYDKIKKKYAKESVELEEAPKVPDGMKFLGAYEYKDANGKYHSHRHYSKGGKMNSPVVVYIDEKEWKTFQSFTKARKAAINHIKGMKESVELDEAALKTSDYPKGTSMSAQKFKDSQKKMSKQRALTTKDYPKGTSMSATAWKNKQEAVEEKAVSKSQQKFMGMVRATQKGDMKDPSPEVAKAAKSMKKKDVKDFASTKHKGLPEMKTFESIRRAMDIAKKSGGNMTGAVKKMDKIKKGVSDNPRVQKALQKANEASGDTVVLTHPVTKDRKVVGRHQVDALVAKGYKHHQKEGVMSKDKEKHDTGGFRISNADAKAARDRIAKKHGVKKEDTSKYSDKELKIYHQWAKSSKRTQPTDPKLKKAVAKELDKRRK